MKKLIVAKSAGFCFGVSRSVDMAEKLISEYGGCASLGELIHNEDVVASLTEKGMRVIHSPAEVSPILKPMNSFISFTVIIFFV